MAEPIPAGTWVEIHRIVLPAGERAPQVPEDTRRVPLEMRLKGFLIAPAAPGDEAEIVTRAGRRWRGTLMAVNPAYTHGFGPPVAELSTIGEEVRALLREGPPQGERKGPGEPPSAERSVAKGSGGVSKGASRRKSTRSTEEG